MENPFKFGTVVSKPHFFNCKEEIEKVKSVLESNNHLILISPRRYGKTSLILNVISDYSRPVIYLDMQIISSITDFAAELLKRIYKLFTFQKMKSLIKNFRIIPILNVNPLNGELSVSIQPGKSEILIIEDVLNMLDNISKSDSRTICIFDEFQEIQKIDSKLDRHLRAIMQHHKNINYVFLGSQESMMKAIFEKKKSPFYHFGYLLNLDKIPYIEFLDYLNSCFELLGSPQFELSKQILEITDSHPYYTQQLAFSVWEMLKKGGLNENIIELSINNIISSHDYDYERLWNNFNQTDKKILIHLLYNTKSMLEIDTITELGLASSTIFSALKRMLNNGYIIRRINTYEIDDPFFKQWIINKRKLLKNII
jgi:AAA+ ATPase superfamily predicted ATPase